MNNNAAKWAGSECEHVTFANSHVTQVKICQCGHPVTSFKGMLIPAAQLKNVLNAIVGSLERFSRCNDPSLHRNIYHLHFPLILLWYVHPAVETCANEPAMISLSLGSRLTVHGRNISTSLAVRTGILEERKTSKLRMSPSISSSGSTSLVIGIFLEILKKKQKQECNNTESSHYDFINYILKAGAYIYQRGTLL